MSQRAGRSHDTTFPVSAHFTMDGWISTGISYDDYRGMGLTKRKHTAERRLPTPQWAINDPQLRRLIVQFMEERAGLRKKKQKGGLKQRLARAQAKIVRRRPAMMDVLSRLCKLYVHVKKFGAYPDKTEVEIAALAAHINGLATPSMYAEHNKEIVDSKRARDLEIEIEGLDTYLRITENGGAGFIVAIVYLYYRVGMDSVGVGAELGLKPPHVRQTLWRLHDCWESMTSHAPVKIGGGNAKSANGDAGASVANTDTAIAGYITPPLFGADYVDANLPDVQNAIA